MAEVNLDDANRAAAQNPFWAIRGHAIQAYASLEQSLCLAFAQLSGIDEKIAGTIFFAIPGPQIRKVLEKLVTYRYGNNYDVFWRSFLKALSQITETRN